MDKDLNCIESSSCGEKEDKQMVGRTTWLRLHYSFKVVYQCLSATNRDVFADCQVA